MARTAFALFRQIQLAVMWYGTDYGFYRSQLNEYNEPIAGQETLVQTIRGIYHSSERSFIELVNNENASVKSKVNRGILCSRGTELLIQQGDHVQIQEKDFYVTTVEPVLYSDNTIVAYEISVEELVEGVETP